MLEVLLLVADIIVLFLYPMQKTYFIWKNEPISHQGYKESVVYWMLYSTSQAGRWMLPVLSFSIARLLVLLVVMFKLPQIASFVFRFNNQEKEKHS